MSLKFREIEVFWAVFKGQSVGEAARLLNVTQPAISMMLKSAENRFGVPLFERSGGRLKPTDAARALFPVAAKLCAEMKEMEDEVMRVRNHPAKVLCIAASRPLAAAYLHAPVSEFRRQHPDTDVTMITVGTEEVLDLAAKGAIDFGIAYGVAGLPDVPAVILCMAEIMCVFRQDHPLALKSVVTPADLAAERVLTYRPSAPFGAEIARAFHDAGVKLTPYLRSTAEAAACLAAQGSGVALIDPVVLNTTPFHDLTMRRFAPRIGLAVQAVTPNGYVLSSYVEGLLERVREAARHTSLNVRRFLDAASDAPGRRLSTKAVG